MAENENGNGAAPQIPQMKILGQFIRDISFENILAQKPVAGQMNPDIQVQVALDGRKGAAENQYEVVSKYNITSKNKGSENVLFVLEPEYSGLFQIENIADEQLHPTQSTCLEVTQERQTTRLVLLALPTPISQDTASWA